MNFHAKSTRAHGDATTFGGAAKPFLDAGINARDLLPLIPPRARMSPDSTVPPANIGKVPGRYNAASDDWRGLTGRHFSDGLSDDVAHAARDWPTGNVGIRGAAFPAIDSDVASDDARRLVDRVIVEFQGFVGPQFAVRTRGTSPRVLYAFAPDGAPLRPRPAAVRFTLPGDKAGVEHVVEVIGAGKHWVASGSHPGGDRYGWQGHADFAALVAASDLLRLTEADVNRILDAVADAVERDGGTVLSRGAAKAAGGGSGKLRDFSHNEPAMPVDAILRGLDRFPNTEAAFPSRESLVSVLSAVRAALGCEAEANEDRVRGWAVDSSDGWCDDAYFGGVWRSLDAGVRAGPDSLYQMLHRAGAVPAADDFPDDDGVGANAIAANAKWEAEGRNNRRRLLQAVAIRWRFKTVNMRTDDTNARVRPARKIDGEELASHWWDGKTTDVEARAIMPEIQKNKGWEAGPQGMWQFLTDLQIAHPNAFYCDECHHPLYDIGHMIPENDAQGNTRYKINMRPLPEAQRIARRLPVGSGDTHPDTLTVLDFVGRIFGRDRDGNETVELKYELDTSAYMLQTGRRPGNMLILQGDSATGKSTYSSMLSLLFDGENAGNMIPGTSLADESAARFAWAPLEGARILQIQELPATKSRNATALLDSKIKIIVDATKAGDRVAIELKGKDSRDVENHARIVVTTNFEGTVDIGEQDRRIFLMENRITRDTNTDRDWWDNTVEPAARDPARVAYFVRYLMDRNISGYAPTAAPPVSDGKAQQQRMSITEPAKRFMHDAVNALIKAKRSVVELREILDLMEAASHNEYANLGDQTDRPAKFTTGAGGNVTMNVLKILQKSFFPLDPKKMRTEKKRWTIYVRNLSPDAAILNEAHRDEVLDALEKDKRDHPIKPEYLPKAARGPVRVPMGDDFPDE